MQRNFDYAARPTPKEMRRLAADCVEVSSVAGWYRKKIEPCMRDSATTKREIQLQDNRCEAGDNPKPVDTPQGCRRAYSKHLRRLAPVIITATPFYARAEYVGQQYIPYHCKLVGFRLLVISIVTSLDLAYYSLW